MSQFLFVIITIKGDRRLEVTIIGAILFEHLKKILKKKAQPPFCFYFLMVVPDFILYILPSFYLQNITTKLTNAIDSFNFKDAIWYIRETCTQALVQYMPPRP